MANYDSYFLKYWWHELIMTCWKLTGIWYSFYYSMVTTYYYFSLSVAHRCTPLLFSSFSSPHLPYEWLKFFLLWLSFQLVLQCQISERYDRITLLLEDISDGSKINSDSSGWHLHFSVTWPPSPLFPTFTSSSHQWFCQLSDSVSWFTSLIPILSVILISINIESSCIQSCFYLNMKIFHIFKTEILLMLLNI